MTVATGKAVSGKDEGALRFIPNLAENGLVATARTALHSLSIKAPALDHGSPP
jgi:hypothetical protein